MMDERRRVTLTKAQCETSKGRELVELLSDLTDDGTVSREETEKLRTWLETDHGVEFAALPFLHEIIEQIFADGEISDDELDRLAAGIERVLPKRSALRPQRTDATHPSCADWSYENDRAKRSSTRVRKRSLRATNSGAVLASCTRRSSRSAVRSDRTRGVKPVVASWRTTRSRSSASRTTRTTRTLS